MTDGRFTGWALERACDCCGARGDAYYEVRYYVLPTRLVRKRHRDLARTATYYRACFEHAPDFPVLVGGRLVLAPKALPQDLTGWPCLACGTPLRTTGELCGVLSYLLIERGVCIEDGPLGFLLRECVERYPVTLLPDVRSMGLRAGAGRGRGAD
jgi:hypothetical protein